MNRSSPRPSISIIIPVLDDARELEGLLQLLAGFEGIGEICVADGGSRDGSRAVAERLGVDWVEAPAGRGVQMNTGAEQVSGEVLWFLHADCRPRPESIGAIREAMSEDRWIMGAFRFALREPRWFRFPLELLVNLRTRIFQLPYGDQGMFCRRKTFKALGGYRPIPVLEDVDLVRRARRMGGGAFVPLPLGVSPRRWDEEGVFRRTLLNAWMVIRHLMGADPSALARYYPEKRGA